jgi:hypothetical protein
MTPHSKLNINTKQSANSMAAEPRSFFLLAMFVTLFKRI